MRKKRTARDHGICYLCGKTGSDTREHVVSKMFFRKSAPKNPLTLPAHRRCNKSTEAAEQRMFIAMSLTRSPEFGIQEQQDRAWRSLYRKEAALLFQSFVQSIGRLPDGSGHMSVPEHAAESLLAKIAKGLIYEKHGRLLLDEVRWGFRTIDANAFFSAPIAFSREVGDVLAARWIVGEKRLLMLIAILGLHHYAIMIATTNEEPGWSHLSWPRAPTRVRQGTS